MTIMVHGFYTPGLYGSADPRYAGSDMQIFNNWYGLKDFGTGLDGKPVLTVIGNYAWAQVEAWLDLQWAHAMAPGANIVVLASGSPVWNFQIMWGEYVDDAGRQYVPDQINQGNNIYLTESEIDVLKQVSVSTVSEIFFTDYWQVYDELWLTPESHQGVTFFAASGDWGPGTGWVGEPAISPNVVAVGGTELVNSSGTIYERAFCGGSFGPMPANPPPGSGGGIAEFDLQPPYQYGLAISGMTGLDSNGNPILGQLNPTYNGLPVSGTNPAHRAFPDVSITSNGIAICLNNNAQGEGGTSLSAPCWAGIMAIVQQMRVANGLPTLSSIDTLHALYSLPAACFNDIGYLNTAPSGPTINAVVGLPLPWTYGPTAAQNWWSCCGPGFDFITGLGSPKCAVLIPALASYVKPSNIPTYVLVDAGALTITGPTIVSFTGDTGSVTINNVTHTLTNTDGVLAWDGNTVYLGQQFWVGTVSITYTSADPEFLMFTPPTTAYVLDDVYLPQTTSALVPPITLTIRDHEVLENPTSIVVTPLYNGQIVSGASSPAVVIANPGSIVGLWTISVDYTPVSPVTNDAFDIYVVVTMPDGTVTTKWYHTTLAAAPLGSTAVTLIGPVTLSGSQYSLNLWRGDDYTTTTAQTIQLSAATSAWPTLSLLTSVITLHIRKATANRDQSTTYSTLVSKAADSVTASVVDSVPTTTITFSLTQTQTNNLLIDATGTKQMFEVLWVDNATSEQRTLCFGPVYVTGSVRW
jgi:hypothetical protein